MHKRLHTLHSPPLNDLYLNLPLSRYCITVCHLFPWINPDSTDAGTHSPLPCLSSRKSERRLPFPRQGKSDRLRPIKKTFC
ncbi:hypothetical protein FKM82_018954 [Ascaphus truei]